MSATNDLLRKRFHEVDVEKEAILEKIAPKQLEYDNLAVNLNELQAQMKEIHDQHLQAEKAKLFELDNEKGLIARALRDADKKSRLGAREQFLTDSEVQAIRDKVFL